MRNPVHDRLQRYGLRPRKALGQHFLAEPAVLSRIVAAIAPTPEDTILEYGAGIGVLTESLLDAGARVIAVELDDALAELLRRELGERPRFQLEHADLARIDVRALMAAHGIQRIRLAGNLPYQLTSHVLFAFLGLETAAQDGVFMMQREVAERLVAPPGGRDYGILSVLLRAFHDLEIVCRVKPGAFVPPPRVESAVLRIVPRRTPAVIEWSERPAFTALVKNTFAERRKVLRNTLKKFYGLDATQLAACETASGIDLGRRPETLAVDEFARLLRALPRNEAQA
jgi:16S rRNA (adenine1518-N6/adenine1519-N6)-dimethyltransferase